MCLIGLIISLSILFAAGLAVYENPQVRQWVDESRRKIAVALHSLGDEIQPPRPSRSDDASTREDESPEAIERRRRAREEILEKGRLMEERRRARQENTSRSNSFDDLVDQEGRLKEQSSSAAISTAAEVNIGEEGLRKRKPEAQGIEMDTLMQTALAEQMEADLFSTTKEQPSIIRDNTTTLSPASSPTEPELPSRNEQPNLLIDTEVASNHPSEQLVDLTPTTTTSLSSAHDDLSELANEAQAPNYWSVNEWADTTGSSFYTPPQSEGNGQVIEQAKGEASGEEGESDLDIVSEAGDGTHTPGSWTEVGSVVSGDE